LKWKSTIVLLVVTIGFGIYLLTYEKEKPGTDQQAERSRKVFNVRASEIRKITLRRKDVTYVAERLERETGKGEKLRYWQITAPLKARAAQSVFEGIASDLSMLQKGVEIPGKNLAEYGLDDPKVKVTFETADGTSGTLNVGDQGPLGEDFYISTDDDPGVYLVPNPLYKKVTLAAREYRDKTLVTILKDEVGTIRIIKQGKAVAIEDTEQGWLIVEPIRTRANSSKIKNILEQLYEQQLTDFLVDDPKDLSAYGLSVPPLVVELTAYDGRKCSLSLGDSVKDNPSHVYALRSGEKTIVSVPNTLIERLGWGLNDLRDRRLLAATGRDFTRIEITGAREIKIHKREGKWRIVRPKVANAQTEAVVALLRRIVYMEAEKFVDDDPKDLARYGLDKPVISVTLVDNSAKKFTVHFGKQLPPDPKSPLDLCYVRTGDEKFVYGASMDVFDEINQDYLRFRNRNVLFKEGHRFVKIVLKRGKLEAELKNIDGNWQMTAPVEAKADNFRANQIARLATRLNAVRFIADKLENLAKYGLDDPYIRAKITTVPEAGGEAETVEILVGAEEPSGGRFAMVSGLNLIFVISAANVKTFSEELRQRQIFSAGREQITALTFNDMRCEKHEDRWRIVKPEESKLDTYLLDLTFSELRPVRAIRFAEYKVAPEKLADYGLDEPAWRIGIELRVGAPVEILIGKKAGEDEYYAMLAGEPFVAVISKTTADRLMLTFEKLRWRAVLE